MSVPESPLCVLGGQLLACADRELLDTPLDALGDRIGDDDTRAILQAIHEAGEADCLRELLAEESLRRYVFAIDVTICVHCQGRMTRFVIPEGVRLLELCTTPGAIARAMAHPFGCHEARHAGLAPQPPLSAARRRRAHPSQLRLALD